MEQPILKIESVSKTYRLGTFGSGTLAGDYLAWMAKRRGEPNPNIRIGQEWRLKNRRFDALDDVSFSVEPGCRLGIIGANGAGKSTLLKLISRITAPSRGSIYLNGRVASMLEVGTGFSPELTGRENIYLNGAILGMQKTTIDGKLQGIIEFSDCAEFIDTPIKRYSSGMKVRLGFAVAAHLDNEIMLMDEVLAVGDVTFQQKCIDKMNEISLDSGRTIIYVSHMMHTVRELCERCIVLDHGKIVFDGEVDDAIQIYMQNNASGAKEYSFTDEPRLFLRRREVRAASLHALRFLNSDTLVFDKDETVDVEIEWE
ncbi:MAG: ABC transporter ATP-binding protein, partial [Oscillospiraceae bacterium]|nr:ABC transporter ATP-binding protein [Oscillospiraceae bacterium]